MTACTTEPNRPEPMEAVALSLSHVTLHVILRCNNFVNHVNPKVIAPKRKINNLQGSFSIFLLPSRTQIFIGHRFFLRDPLAITLTPQHRVCSVPLPSLSHPALSVERGAVLVERGAREAI